jgi:hypothetical protein
MIAARRFPVFLLGAEAEVVIEARKRAQLWMQIWSGVAVSCHSGAAQDVETLSCYQ